MFVKHRFVLSEKTKGIIRGMEPIFGYNGFGEITFYRTFSRKKKDGGQENWADVMIRVTEGTFSIRKDWHVRNNLHWDEEYWQNYAKRFIIAMFKMQWLPPGRGMWAMGTDYVYARGSMSLNNCFSGNTKFMTAAGIRTLEQYKNVQCTVWGKDKKWHDGHVEHFGKQRLYQITFDIAGTYVVHYATRNHKWFLYPSKNNKDNITDDLQIGDRVLHVDHGFARVIDISGHVEDDVYCVVEPETNSFMLDSGIITHNCGATFIHNNNFANDIGWGMDALMNGVGVGYRILIEEELKVREPKGNYEYVIPDTREGWVDSVIKKIEAYINGTSMPRFVYDEIRPAGSIIRGFGGISAGPEPLKMFHNAIDEYFHYYMGDKTDYTLTHLKADIANSTGTCVVAGNVRRCLPRGTRVLTDMGNIPIEDVVAYKHKVWTTDGYKDVTANMVQGKRTIWYFRLSNGLTFECTPNHRVLATDSLDNPESCKWKRADELTLSDYLLMNNRPVEFLYPKTLRQLSNSILDNDAFDYRLFECTEQTRKNYVAMMVEKYGETSCDYVILKNDNIVNNFQILCSSIGYRTNSIQVNDGYMVYIQQTTTSNPVWPVKLELIHKSQKQEFCYDLTVKDKPEFFANGILVHNSAEMLMGSLYDDTFLDLKNYSVNSYREGIGWMSNNSVVLHEDLDFERMDEIAERIKSNGEPGYINLRNFQYGRIGKHGDETDHDQASLSNPCGEITLENKELCNVVETLPTKCQTIEDWFEACEFSTFYASTVSLLLTHSKETNKILIRNRRIGVSIVDVTGWIHDCGINKVVKWMRKGYRLIREINRQLANEAGVPPSIKVTTIKPGGTIPKLAGKTPGIGYPTFEYTIRRIRVQKNSPVDFVLQQANIPFQEDAYSLNTNTYEYPIIQGPAKPGHEVSLWQQAMNLVMMQREWADNSVSNTLYFKPQWEVCSVVGVICTACEFQLYTKEYTSSAMNSSVDCPRCNAKVYPSKQLHESLEHVRFRYNFSPNREFNYDREYRLKFVMFNNTIHGFQVLKFNPNHEEDDIEHVLASIAPLVKSVSLLPHSAIGAYVQMPEEGITKERYHHLLESISPINWSLFRDSDGEDERYCSGPTCERIQQ